MRKALLVIAGVVALALLAWVVCFGERPTAPAASGKKWHEQVYGLDDEVIRLVPPPHSPERMRQYTTWFASIFSGTRPPAAATGQLAWWFKGGSQSDGTMSTRIGTLWEDIYWSTRFSRADVEMANHLRILAIDGDLCVRTGETGDRIMVALRSIASLAAGKNLIFDKKLVERDVIVATGKWSFQNLELGGRAVGAVRFYVDEADLQGGQLVTHDNDLSFLIARLERMTARKVIDEIEEPRPTTVPLSTIQLQHQPGRDEASMVQFLANVEKQTSLRFVRAKRVVPIWFVSDSSATTQEGGGS